MIKENEKVLEVAQYAAMKAGNFLKEHFGRKTDVRFKGKVDLITKYDIESQAIIRNVIEKAFPEDSILGEEDLDCKNHNSSLWIIDPIDGTTNFAHHIPMFSVSIGFMREEQLQVGLVYLPVLDELFYAMRGRGAFLNGKPISVSQEKDISKSLIATGFPYDRFTCPDNNADNFNRFITKIRGIRRMGSASIDLCYTAAGRFSGYWEKKLKPWDCAGGAIIVEEAGGRMSDFSGGTFDLYGKECLASNGLIHEQMIKILNEPL